MGTDSGGNWIVITLAVMGGLLLVNYLLGGRPDPGGVLTVALVVGIICFFSCRKDSNR